MSVSDAEHQTRPENQYFVDTGVGEKPGLLDSLYHLYEKRKTYMRQKSEPEKTIEALQTQIVELKGQLKSQTDLVETIRESKNLLQQQVNRGKTNLQTRQVSQIIQLKNQISKLSTHIDKLDNSRLQNLCKETTFACQLLEMAVNSVPQEIVKQHNTLFVLAKTIQRYIKEHASQAKELLIKLQHQTDDLGNLKDGHGLNTSLLTENQHEVVKFLLELMLSLINNTHFKSQANLPKSATQLYGDVMKNYYNTHASTWLQMGEAGDEVKKLLDDEQKILDLS
jgi:chromosome segregation ATPase